MSSTPKGFFTRGYLPHLDQPGLVQMITFRLADSLPANVREQIREWEKLKDAPPVQTRLQELLDNGIGECLLREDRFAQLVENALHHFDGTRYRLLAWVIMPNHVHVLIETLPGFSLPQIVQSWKSFTGREANRLLGRTGAFWFADYFDRFIRDERHLRAAVEYIVNNPVKAGLVDEAKNWRYSSAWEGQG